MASPPTFLDLYVKFLLFATAYIVKGLRGKGAGEKGCRGEGEAMAVSCQEFGDAD